MAVSHAKSQTGAAWTGTVTVFNSQGSTATIAATDLVRPGDWNSAHNFFQTISGNTAGSSTASGTNLVIGGSNNITASLSTAAGAATLWMSGPNLTQYLTTARASNDAVGLNTAATNVTWTVGSAGISLNAGAYLTTAQPPGAYLTTARASNDAIGLNTAATQVTWTVNSSGISLNAGAYLTTARASNDAIGLNTALTANGVSWTVNSSGLSLNVPAFLTTAANSTHSHGNPTLALTNLSGTTASASNGLTLSLSAAAGGGGTVSYYATNNTTQTSSGTYANSLVVSGAGILSAGMTGNTLILSVPAGGGAGDGYNIIQGSGNTAGTMNTYASATFVLAGGPSITLSQSSNTMSINAPAQSVLTYAGGVSLSSNGSTITVSGIPVAVSAGTQASSTFQTLSLANSNGLSWSTGTQGLYGSHNGLTTAAQSDHSHGNPTLALTNLSGTTASASNGLTLSLSAAAPGGGAAYTALSYINRQFALSTTQSAGQNSLWVVPFRLAAPVSGSSLAHAYSFSGTITSAANATAGATMRYGIYSQHATDPNRFDSWWSSSNVFTFWNSGTSSYSYSYNVTSGSSAGSNLATASVMGLRLITCAIGSEIPAGLYLYASVISTSSAGYSAAMSRMVPLMDNAYGNMGFVGSATNASVGFADAGTWTSATTGALPASISIGHIAPVSNMQPVFKIGAI